MIHDTLNYPTQRELIKLSTSWAHGKILLLHLNMPLKEDRPCTFCYRQQHFLHVQMDHKNPKNEKGSGGKRDKERDMLHKTNDILNANFV